MSTVSAPSAVVEAVLAELKDQPGALLPVLHALQDRLGFVPPATLPQIARALHLSRAEVHGVVSFYHHFRSEPLRAPLLQLCRAEACRSMGAERLHDQAAIRAAAGGCTLESAYCLGLCAQSPALMLDGRLHARVTPARLDALLDAASAAATSAPISTLTTEAAA